MKKFIISESEKKQILGLYYPKTLNESNEQDHWEPVNIKINQKVTILDPSKFNNKVAFENMGFVLTIIEVDGDVITANAERDERDMIRLQKLLNVSGPQFRETIKFKVDLSSAKEYQYTKNLNDKSLLNNLKSATPIGARGSIEFLIRNVTEKNTSKIQFVNFPDKENPLTATLPAGTVTITHWYYDHQEDVMNTMYGYPSYDEVELGREDRKRQRKKEREYYKQFRKYKKTQKDLEDEQESQPIALSSTGTLEEALNALSGKICKLNGRLYRINEAKIETKKKVTLYCDLQKTNMNVDKPKFSGGEFAFYFACGKTFIYDKNQYQYNDVEYGDTTTNLDGTLNDDLQDYVCKYLG